MSHLACPRCRLRFSPLAAAYMTACPECGELPAPVDDLRGLVGFRLLDPVDLSDTLPEALDLSLPVPPPDGNRWSDRDR